MADKKKLLMAVKQCGTKNIAEVQKFLPEKTITDIRLAFEKYSQLACEKLNQDEKLHDDDSAINQWIKIVQKTNNKNSGVINIIPRVLKYIALFEKRPHDKDVNLKDCYIALSKITNGLVSKKLNPTTNQFFFENLTRLALKIKKEDNCKRKEFARNIKKMDDIFKPQVVKTYNRKKKKVNTILNPLNIPEQLLKINEKGMSEENGHH